jgi:hypothetical protein
MVPSQAQCRDLAASVAYWESRAFFCTDNGLRFPSKESRSSDPCDDGDMTLFNGLLCASGDARGCDAVQRAQGADGRWWRSPRRIGWEAPDHDVSFSPDQALGVLLYVVSTGDAASFSKWLSWIENNRACLIAVGGRCVQNGWLRFCRDDRDKRCALRPADCVRIEALAGRLGVDGGLCRRVMKELGLPEEVLLPVEDFLLGAAAANERGYPLHLAAVGVFLAQRAGLDTPKLRHAAATIATREPENPFFQFLSEGKTDAVRSKLLATCPAPERPSGFRFQWTWEREPNIESWKESMYWECIFLAALTR